MKVSRTTINPYKNTVGALANRGETMKSIVGDTTLSLTKSLLADAPPCLSNPCRNGGTCEEHEDRGRPTFS